LTDPRAIERFLKTYVEERKRLAAAEETKRLRKETRLGEVQREFKRVYNSYVKGMITEEETGPLLAQLREEREALKAELATMGPTANVVTLHPGAVKRYLEVVNDLATSLPYRRVASDEGISTALRELVSSVTIAPTTDREKPTITIAGRLAVLVGADLFPHARGDIGGSGGPLRTPDTRIKSWMAEGIRLHRTRYTLFRKVEAQISVSGTAGHPAVFEHRAPKVGTTRQSPGSGESPEPLHSNSWRYCPGAKVSTLASGYRIRLRRPAAALIAPRRFA